MGKTGKIDKPILSEREMKFVQHFHGNATEAARIAGYKNPELAGNRLRYRPRVKAAIERIHNKALEQAGKELGHKLAKTISKLDVVDKLMALAEIDPLLTNNNITGQVSALKAIAEIEGYIIKKSQDVTELAKGRSVEEMEFFAQKGYWPDQENAQSTESSISGAKTPDAGSGKPH